MRSHSLGKGLLNTNQEWHHGHVLKAVQTLGRRIALVQQNSTCVLTVSGWALALFI